MEKIPKITAKDFFLWAGAMVTFYWSIFAFVSLIFDYLNHAFPDPLPYYAGSYAGNVSYEMAALIVLFPVFLLLMRVIRRSIEGDPSRAQIWVRRWALVLTLFVAGAALAGDLITLIKYFFDGDVTVRFLLKVLVVFLVAGGVFLHFLADMRGYYERNPDKARLMTWATAVLVLVTIVAGFFIVGTPWEARKYRFDEQKVSDLQNIQYQVVNYWQLKQALPAALTDLADPISGAYIPVDPQTGQPYEYSVTGPMSFELCASFNAEARSQTVNGRTVPLAPYPAAEKGVVENWQHGEGRTCFTRTIDPERYPPLNKVKP